LERLWGYSSGFVALEHWWVQTLAPERGW